MHTAAIIVACFAGQFAFAFLMGSMALLAAPPKGGLPDLPDGPLALRIFLLFLLPLFFLELISGGGGSFIVNAVVNWPKQEQARRLTYLGAGCFALTVISIAASKIYS